MSAEARLDVGRMVRRGLVLWAALFGAAVVGSAGAAGVSALQGLRALGLFGAGGYAMADTALQVSRGFLGGLGLLPVIVLVMVVRSWDPPPPRPEGWGLWAAFTMLTSAGPAAAAALGVVSLVAWTGGLDASPRGPLRWIGPSDVLLGVVRVVLVAGVWVVLPRLALLERAWLRWLALVGLHTVWVGVVFVGTGVVLG